MHWLTHVINVNAPTDVDTLEETTNATLDHFIFHPSKTFDIPTSIFDREVNVHHMAAVLRILSTLTYAVPNYNVALWALVQQINNAGLDPYDLLLGMIPSREKRCSNQRSDLQMSR